MLEHILGGIVLSLMLTLPLAWKWQLGVFRVGCTVTILAVLSGLLVGAIGRTASLGFGWRCALVAALAFVTATLILAYRFYRDPDRVAPDGSDLIVSPADGTVIYVLESKGGMLPVSTKKGRPYPLVELTKTPLKDDDAVVIGIAMNFLDVHVNRAPIAGKVTLQKHFSGLFGSLRNHEMVFENERATTIIENGMIQVAVVQIASRLVRQIVSWVREGQDLCIGQRIGAIRLGSQVDLVIPAVKNLKVAVQPGQYVYAGRSVVATLSESKQVSQDACCASAGETR